MFWRNEKLKNGKQNRKGEKKTIEQALSKTVKKRGTYWTVCEILQKITLVKKIQAAHHPNKDSQQTIEKQSTKHLENEGCI